MERTRNDVVFEREEVVLSPSDRKPFFKTCHFLNPCFPSSHQGPFPEPPPVSTPFLTSPEHPSGIRFNYPIGPTRSWVEWVELMEPLHGPTWRKAGISEAIRCSTYRIQRDKGLILGLAEKWSSETNSFVFPWGEASVTLEDVYILWGYSVCASPVSPWDEEMVDAERRLIAARLEIIKSKARKATCGHWMNNFKGSDSDIGHEAFLAFWLSRFVFPRNRDTIYDDLFPIAIHLARGDKVAIAPDVLASIYRELSLLKMYICDLAAGKSNLSNMILWAPFGILQVWAWERFMFPQPQPKIIRPGEPRLSRWVDVGCYKQENIRAVLKRIDAGNHFEWRPYTKDVENFEVPRFYGKRERWERLSGEDLEDEEKMFVFARCLVTCKLKGFRSTEKYLPNRVAMQLGMDQDIPDHISRYDESSEVSWKSYNCSFHDAWLYLPSRGYNQCLTKRYNDWLMSRSKDGLMERSTEAAEESSISVPPCLSPIPRYVRRVVLYLPSHGYMQCLTKRCGDWCRSWATVGPVKGSTKAAEGSFPPGFSSIPRYVVTNGPSDEEDDDNLTLRELRSKLARRDVRNRSSVPESSTKMQKSMGTATGNRNSPPPGLKLNSATTSKCPSKSCDDDRSDHSMPGAIPFRQQKSVAVDCFVPHSESIMNSVRPHESPSRRTIVILSGSVETSDKHDPIRENTSMDPTIEGAGGAAEDYNESSSERTHEQESSASLGRNRTVFPGDMGIAGRISKLERDVADLKWFRSNAGRHISRKQDKA